MNFEELTAHTMKLLAIPTVQSEPEENAPFGAGNRAALDYVLTLAKKLGFRTKDLDGYCGYAEIGEGEPFAVLGHLDVVPDGEGWTKNPLGEISDGKIYGRGIMDDKGPILACLCAAKRLLDEGLTPKRRLRFIFGCNEESGWGCIERYKKTEENIREGFSPDADFPVIYAEKGIVNYRMTFPLDCDLVVSGGTRANVVPNKCTGKIGGLSLSTTGTAAHGSHPEAGDNAIIKMLRLLRDKSTLAAELSDKLSDCFGTGCGLDMHDDDSGDLTLNVGTIETDNQNQPKTLSVVLDIRYPVTKTEDEVYMRLEEAFPSAEITKTHFHLPLFADKDCELVKTLLAAYEKVTGEKGLPVAIGGGTYARALEHGVAFGPEFPGVVSTIHSPDERVSLADFEKIFDIYTEALRALCF